MIEEHPCKVTVYKSSKPGKHGARKIRYVGVDVLNGRKLDTIYHSDDRVYVPIITRKDYEVTAYNKKSGILSLVNKEFHDSLQLPMPDKDVHGCSKVFVGKALDLTNKIKQHLALANTTTFVCVWNALGQNVIASTRKKKAVAASQFSGEFQDYVVLSKKEQRKLKRAQRRAAKAKKED